MYSYDLLKEEISKGELTLDDLKVWYVDYRQVQIWFNLLQEHTEKRALDEQLDFLIERLHHNNAFSICSDTSEPLEYIDFNYGSLTCTISIYDKPKATLLPSFEGYISRGGEELEGCYTDVDFESVCKIIEESEVK